MPRATAQGHVVGQTVKNKVITTCTGYRPRNGPTVPTAPFKGDGMRYLKSVIIILIRDFVLENILA